MRPADIWWQEGDDECLRLGSLESRSWSFFWPGRLVVEPLTDGVVWSPRDASFALPVGTKLVAPPNAVHVRVSLRAGAAAKIRFAPVGSVTPILRRVFLPEILASDATESAPRATVIVPGYVARAYRELIDAEGDLSLRELAKRVQLERSHFCRAYQRAIGLPPCRHRQHLRITHARALLRAGHDCTSVAYAIGYCDQSHFTRSFKELTGSTPSIYARAFQPAHRVAA